MTARTRLLLTLIAISMILIIPGTLRGQESVRYWEGITGQGERFTLMVDGDTITFLNVGIFLSNQQCKTYRSITRTTGLGYVVNNRFHIVVHDSEGTLVVKGIPGWNGHIEFVSGEGQPCQGSVYTTWWIPGKTMPPMPEYGEASSSIPPPTPLPTAPPPTPTRTPLRKMDQSWDGVPYFMRPTSRPTKATGS